MILAPGHIYFMAANPIDSNTVFLHPCSLRDWTRLLISEIEKQKQEFYEESRCDGVPIERNSVPLY